MRRRHCADEGFGSDFMIGLPIVGNQRVSVPIEEMAQRAVDAEWPDLQRRLGDELAARMPGLVATLQAQVPGIVNQIKAGVSSGVTSAVQGAAPDLLAQATHAIEAEVPKLLSTAQSMLVNQWWPALQPKVKTELDGAVKQITKVYVIVGVATISAVVLAAILKD